MEHDAFISYSHEADGTTAPVIQRTVEGMAKPWYRRRALRVFRDETGLSANPALWDSIVEVLDDSAWFILLASPGAAGSTWVNREIEHWLETKGGARILPVLTSGTWVWDEPAADFDPSSTAVPPALRGAFEQEPRHIDLSWLEGREVDRRDPRFRDQVAEIAAPLRGVSKDDLAGADLREHRRTMRLARFTVVLLIALMCVAVVGAVLAVDRAGEAETARDRATRARDLAAKAREESDFQRVLAQSHDLAQTNREVSLLLAVEARHERNTTESRSALQSALTADARYLAPVRPEGQLGYAALCLSADGRTAIVGGEAGSLGFVDLRSGDVVGTLRPPGASPKYGGLCVMSPDRTHGLAVSDGRMWAFDPRTRRITGRPWSVPSSANQAAIASDGGSVMVGTIDGRTLVGDASSPVLREIDSSTGAAGVAFAPDGKTAASTTRRELVIWDTATWSPLRRIADPPADQGGGVVTLDEASRRISFMADGRTLCDSRRGGLRVFDVASGSERWRRSSEDIVGQRFALSPNSRWLFLAGLGSSVQQIDVTTGEDAAAPMNTQSLAVTGVAVTADSSTLVVATGSDGALQRWSLDGRSVISRVVPVRDQVPHAYSADGSRLLTYPTGGGAVVTARVLDLRTGDVLAEPPLAAVPTLLANGQVAGYFVSEGGAARYDVDHERLTGPRFPLDLAGVVQATVDRRGMLVVGRTDGTLERYDPDGKQVGAPWARVPDGSAADFIEISPRGDAVVVTVVGQTTVVYPLRGSAAHPRVLDPLFDPHFTADGSMIAGFTASNQYRFVDWKTGKTIGKPIPTDGGGYFSQQPAGDLFLIYSSAGGRLYDRRTRRPVGEVFPSAGSPVLRSGGRQLATSTGDGIVLWDLDASAWERAACQVAGRNLTRSEWRRYFPNAKTYRRTCSEWPAGGSG